MRTLIFRFTAPYLTSLMVLFSVFVTLRGHNEPGGGFIGGLIAASAFAIYGIACGVGPVRRALYFHPMGIAGAGLCLATLSGFASLVVGRQFLSGLWAFPALLGGDVGISTPLFFDLGVYLVVVGAITSIALALEEKGQRLMETVLSAIVGILFAMAIYLLLSTHIIRMLMGLVLLGNGVNLLIFTAGRSREIAPPLIPPNADVLLAPTANPLPQALILTAIVISFSFFAFLLVLAYRAFEDLGTDDTDEMRLAEPEEQGLPPLGY